MRELQLEAYAKLNLGLKILGKRPDGYHEIETLFQSIDLHDTLTLELHEQPRIALQIDSPWPIAQGRENLVYRAAEMVLSYAAESRGVRIFLKKRIPVGAGLGGGSSDAAATLVGLNQLLGLHFRSTDLHSLALKLGSDVPYFLVGGLCRGRGRGELLERLPPLWGDYTFVLVKPPCSLSTEEVYREYDHLVERGWQPSLADSEFIVCVNDLEEAALRLCPELRDCRQRIAEFQPDLWGLSGSGPTYYAAWRSPTSAAQAYATLEELRKKEGYWLAQARATDIIPPSSTSPSG
ncbi:MAG: 4-(cytidine 5'-diphospho)-2-C-methyl-D-erythritol kinase [Candidatus Bipolaricaulota bacterium]|nr:4-(cytidine 5'-diphospho)-2-C-methyl-D-erythritol kinase [Candidatus Bipolaricaulota bacterium]MDW8110303.1 4-(cytidine 5'-diphospho)-2-C-methyl-D-erythritol kinase [Candidatus Bipolaricaulota bacterium]MDW8328801.1 4-(cytidine 5'-diphospho)-2-C-methyl-D-erythritol kinase [Candidatus Bipolaricaulota bacterium]